MEPFVRHRGLVALLDRTNVDTDQIIPKQFLKRIERSGFGQFLFFDWRYREDGKTLRPDFELNRPRFKGASILVTGANFGCGSSREHAPWALQDFGFRVIVAASFADIFYNNCFKNGILPVTLTASEVSSLGSRVQSRPDYHLTVDLPAQEMVDDRGWKVSFRLDPFRKQCLLKGLDDIALTLQVEEKIRQFERQRQFPGLQL